MKQVEKRQSRGKSWPCLQEAGSPPSACLASSYAPWLLALPVSKTHLSVTFRRLWLLLTNKLHLMDREVCVIYQKINLKSQLLMLQCSIQISPETYISQLALVISISFPPSHTRWYEPEAYIHKLWLSTEAEFKHDVLIFYWQNMHFKLQIWTYLT